MLIYTSVMENALTSKTCTVFHDRMVLFCIHLSSNLYCILGNTFFLPSVLPFLNSWWAHSSVCVCVYWCLFSLKRTTTSIIQLLVHCNDCDVQTQWTTISIKHLLTHHTDCDVQMQCELLFFHRLTSTFISLCLRILVHFLISTNYHQRYRIARTLYWLWCADSVNSYFFTGCWAHSSVCACVFCCLFFNLFHFSELPPALHNCLYTVLTVMYRHSINCY